VCALTPEFTQQEAKERWYTAQATIEKFRRRLGLHSRLSLEGIVALAKQLWELYLASAASATKKEARRSSFLHTHEPHTHTPTAHAHMTHADVDSVV
jgi:hypothetical protein